jgi:hypothetical protein
VPWPGVFSGVINIDGPAVCGLFYISNIGTLIASNFSISSSHDK